MVCLFFTALILFFKGKVEKFAQGGGLSGTALAGLEGMSPAYYE